MVRLAQKYVGMKHATDEIFRMLHESDRGGSAIIRCSVFDIQKSCHFVLRLNNYLLCKIYRVKQTPSGHANLLIGLRQTTKIKKVCILYLSLKIQTGDDMINIRKNRLLAQT
jgi:hypothetical protein